MTIAAPSLSTILFGLIYPLFSEPLVFVAIGFCLLLSIYVLVALLYGVYTPELFPTDVRLRANGICNMLGRGATIVSPFIVVALFKAYGVSGVTTFSRLPQVNELDGEEIDLAVLGIPFDGLVTYRPGARFGPNAIRQSSVFCRGYSQQMEVGVYERLRSFDAGDVNERSRS